jgi:5'-nucleotidase (lipoprotein e(P4) family)
VTVVARGASRADDSRPRLAMPTLLLLIAAASGCASNPAPATSGAARAPAPVAAAPGVRPVPSLAADSIPLGLRWYRASAERRAIYLQAYRAASATVERRAAALAPGSWAVILDADETVLDNSPYEQELAERHASYDEASWRAWVLRQSAAALPGAVAFTARVRALGGRVVIVTNRDDAYCDATRANLQRAGIAADEVLCRTDPKSGSKAPRFEAVATGTAPSTLGPLTVVMWVGDNIQDFPRLTQSIRTASDSAFADFGETYIVLPNPMYGSWEKNPLP